MSRITREENYPFQLTDIKPTLNKEKLGVAGLTFKRTFVLTNSGNKLELNI